MPESYRLPLNCQMLTRSGQGSLRIAQWLCGVLLIGAWQIACAQGWPARPIRLLVGQSTGSSPDLIARLLAERLAPRLGQSVLVENRGGGDGALGAQAVARAAPDGLTILFGTAGALVVNQFTFKSLGYVPERDLAGVAMIGMSPFIVVANPDINLRSIADLITLARSAPSRVAFTSPGPRSLPGMIAEMFAVQAGATMVNVPNNGSMGLQDLMSGRTQFSVQGIPAVTAPLRDHRLVALAVTGARRLPEFEHVPTLADTFAGFDSVGWFAIMAPSGTHRDIVDRLNLEIDRIISSADVSARLRFLGIYPEPGLSASALDQFIAQHRARWSALVQSLHIEPQ